MNQTNNRAVYGKSHVSLVLHICSFLYNKQTNKESCYYQTQAFRRHRLFIESTYVNKDCKMSKKMVSKAFSAYGTVGTWGQGTNLPLGTLKLS